MNQAGHQLLEYSLQMRVDGQCSSYLYVLNFFLREYPLQISTWQAPILQGLVLAFLFVLKFCKSTATGKILPTKKRKAVTLIRPPSFLIEQ